MTKKKRWWERLAEFCIARHRFILIRDHLNKKILYLARFFLYGHHTSEGFRVLLHNMHTSDQDGLHCHQWSFISIVLSGGYYEQTQFRLNWRRPGSIVFRSTRTFHRVVLKKDKNGNTIKPWTLIITFPRNKKGWGFLVRLKNGLVRLVPWEQYLGKTGSLMDPKIAKEHY